MNETMLDDEQLGQLKSVLSSLTVDLELKLTLDDADTSQKLRTLANQLAGVSNGRITVSAEQVEEPEGSVDMQSPLPATLPMLRLLAKNAAGAMQDTGIAFHGVPGGRQLIALLSGILDAAGEGSRVDHAARKRIKELDKDVDVLLLVSLTCPYCQATVEACDRIATLTDKVHAEAYDIELHPELAEMYPSEGVPVIVVTPADATDATVDGTMTVGGHDVDEMMELIDRVVR